MVGTQAAWHRFLIGVVALMLITGGLSFAQEPPTVPDEGGEWLGLVEEATQEGVTVNVEEVTFANDSFFDVFVNVVLREGLPPDIQDPLLGTALSSDEVTEIIRSQGPELYDALQRVQLSDGRVVQVAPGAAVFKWDPEGRWSRGPHRFEIYTWVMVNQWIRASMNTSKLVWKVFKPGVYSTDCMYMNVHSNGRMRLTLENNGPLTDPAGETMGTAYALSEYIQTPVDLVVAGQTMLGATPVIDWVPDQAAGEAVVGRHALVKVWNSINVNGNAGPGLYTTPGASAVITVAPEF
jgi:hypothetical protein